MIELSRITDHWPAKVLSLMAALLLSFLYHADTLEERFFSVPLEIRLNDGFVPASSYQQNVRIILRGREDEIFSILEDDIHAWVDFTAHSKPGLYKAPISINRMGTALDVENLEIKVEPLEVTLLQERRMTRSLEVGPDLKGSPARGYRMVQYFLTPSSVTVEGPRSRVENLKKINTEEIDLTGRREDFTARVRLAVTDPLIQLPGGDIVEFRGVIAETQMVKSYRKVPLVALGLAEKLEIAGALPLLTVQIQGFQPRLESLRPAELRFTLDCSGITEPGEYRLPVEARSPRGAAVLSFSPEEVLLQVEEREDAGTTAPIEARALPEAEQP